MVKKTLYLLGGNGLISKKLVYQLENRSRNRDDLDLYTIHHSKFNTQNEILFKSIQNADLVIVCTDGMKSKEVVEQLQALPRIPRILDVSPAYRCHDDWLYGMQELYGHPDRYQLWLETEQYVANPGCFASAALLLLRPLTRGNLIKDSTPLYLDAVGGYTTGGQKMVDAHEQTQLPRAPIASVFSLNKRHAHLDEIEKMSGIGNNQIFFTPKIAAFPTGIRMQVWIPNVERDKALQMYKIHYMNQQTIDIDYAQPSNVRCDEWAHCSGAIIRAYEHGDGCLVTCSLDNLRMGSIDTIMHNTRLMLKL